jgi:uncharacterized protein YdhG (YjbR/CyaY superfamily)
MSKPATIEEYIGSANPEAQPLLRELLLCLRQVVPSANEGIKWGVPTFTKGRILFTFAARKDHVGFFPTPSAIKAFAAELKGYQTTKSSIKLPLDKPLPIDLIRSVASYRLRDVIENDSRWM